MGRAEGCCLCAGAAPELAAASDSVPRQCPSLPLTRRTTAPPRQQVSKPVSFEPRLAMRRSWLTPNSADRGAEYQLVATVSHHGKVRETGRGTGWRTVWLRSLAGGRSWPPFGAAFTPD